MPQLPPSSQFNTNICSSVLQYYDGFSPEIYCTVIDRANHTQAQAICKSHGMELFSKSELQLLDILLYLWDFGDDGKYLLINDCQVIIGVRHHWYSFVRNKCGVVGDFVCQLPVKRNISILIIFEGCKCLSHLLSI